MNNFMPIRQRLSSKQGFPLRLFAAAFAISLLIAVFSGWQSWQLHTRFETMSKKHVTLTENVGRIMLIDEVLTMSARMAAATGDFGYEKRYDQFDPQLTAEINEIRAILPQLEIAQFVGKTDEANHALVKMERQAIALAHQGKRQEAMALLTSAEYMQLKKIYAGGMEKTANAATNMIDKDTSHLRLLSVGLALISCVGALLLLAAWFFAIRSARSWTEERGESEDALRKAYDTLEVRIKQRTADLSEANEQLQREISEHRKAEASLKNMAEKYRTVFESSSDAIILYGEQGFFDCNPAALRIFCCPSREEVLHKHPAEFSPPTQPGGEDSMSLANGHIAKAFKHGSNRFEWMHRRFDGTDFLAEVLLSALELDGKPVLQATVRDNTERIKADSALNNEALRRRILMEGSRDGIAIINQRHQVIEANPCFAQMLGYTPEEMLRLHSWDFDATMTKAEIQEKFSDLSNANITFETRHRRKNGSIYEVEVSISGALVDNEAMVFTISRDITERKQSEARYRALVDNMNDGVAVYQAIDDGQDFVFNEYNKASEQFGKLSRDQVVGRRVTPMFSPV